MPDAWEMHYFGATGISNRNGDYDFDDLSDLGEYLAGTDPTRMDTDGDGLRDGVDDSDADGIADVRKSPSTEPAPTAPTPTTTPCRTTMKSSRATTRPIRGIRSSRAPSASATPRAAGRRRPPQ
ncbi:MAG: hypothetical protein U1F77_08525 [Kiritimatiellia bacterium]